MQSLVTFLNHGILPFIGREEQIERVLQFWRGGLESSGLRALLVVGEAGVGKSRLIEETLARVGREAGATIHIKLYPDSTTTLSTMVAEALERSAAAIALHASSDGSLAGGTAAIRRISRLRPLLLVIEDVHLLQREAARELGTLFTTLGDELLTVVLAARPVEMEARSVIEPWLVEEMEIDGLKKQEVEELWGMLYGKEPDQATVETLCDATAGNALALRSALRGAMTSSAQQTTATISPPSNEQLRSAVQRGTDLLASGLVAHLSDKEYRDATVLASLGEMFSVEAARILLVDADTAIETLRFKGVLTRATSGPHSVSARVASKHPLLAFTHTLVHQHLVERSTPRFDSLVHAIGEQVPLYSFTPFILFTEASPTLQSSAEALRRGIASTFAIANDVRSSSDWRFSDSIISTARLFLEHLQQQTTPEESFSYEAGVLSQEYLNASTLEDEERRSVLMDQMLVLTAPLATTAQRDERLRTLAHRCKYFYQGKEDISKTVWGEALALIDNEPSLRRSRKFILLLQSAAIAATNSGNTPWLREIETEMRCAEEDPLLSTELRQQLRFSVGRYMLLFTDTHEELEQRSNWHPSWNSGKTLYATIPICASVSSSSSITAESSRERQRACRRPLPTSRDGGFTSVRRRAVSTFSASMPRVVYHPRSWSGEAGRLSGGPAAISKHSSQGSTTPSSARRCCCEARSSGQRSFRRRQ